MSDHKIVSFPVSASLCTDLANGERLVSGYREYLAFTKEAGWWVYDGRVWRNDRHAALAFAKKCSRQMYREAANISDQDRAEFLRHVRKSQDLHKLKAMLEIACDDLLIEHSAFDADPHLLNVSNGTIDLRQGALLPHNAQQRCTMISPVVFDHRAECPRWHEFLETVMASDTDMIRFLQRMVGYLLCGLTIEQCLFVSIGEGLNGKSLFRETVQKLLGGYSRMTPESTIRLSRNDGIPNDIARLAGCRMAAVSEISHGTRLNEGRIKDLTGGDMIAARFLHREYFEFRPQFKMLITGNHKPEISGIDDGIWRRIRLVPFRVKIPESKRDPNLAKKLAAELPGILNWALAGFNQWQQEGLNPPPDVLAAVEQYRAEMDSVGLFINENCSVMNPSGETKARDLLDSYNKWAVGAGTETLTAVKLALRLTARGYKRRRTASGQRWVGIALSNRSGV